MPARAFVGRDILEGLLLAAAYAACGKLSLELALPPGYASAIFPPAGIALAFVLQRGRVALPWVFLGSFSLNLWVALASAHPLTLAGILAAAAIAAASCLQAGVGGWLLWRMLKRRLAFDQIGDVLAFLLLAPLFCLVSATLSVAALVALGLAPASAYTVNWATWWLGDLLGAYVFMPLTLVLIGRPRPVWLRRRASVGVPMLLAFASCLVLYTHSTRWEQERELRDFQMQSVDFADQIQTRLEEQEFLLRQVAAFLAHRDAGGVSREEFHRFVGATLDRYPMLQAVEWAPRVRLDERAAFEAAQQRSLPGFLVRENDEPDPFRPAEARPVYYPVTFLEPFEANRLTLGFDLASTPYRREALEASSRGGMPVATPPLRLVQDRTRQHTVLLMMSVAHGSDAGGYALTALRFEDFIDQRLSAAGGAFTIELFDEAARESLYGTAEQAAASVPHFERRLAFGTRVYRLRTFATPAYLQAHRGWQSLALLAGGLFGTGLLGALLLLGTGVAARAERLVRQRTVDLERESGKNQLLLRNSSDGIHILEPGGRIIEASDSFCRMLGYTRAEVIGMHMTQWDANHDPQELAACLAAQLASDDLAVFETRHRRKDGSTFDAEVTACAIELAGERVLFTSSRDVTERKTAEERILHLAYFDTLTELPNRRLFVDRLRQAAAASARSGEYGAVMMIDLDQFKKLNDTRGHDTGDRLLVSVAGRLATHVRAGDTICRLGGDEFLLLMVGLGSEEPRAAARAEAVAEKIRAELGRPHALGGSEAEYRTTPSIGVTLYRGHETPIEGLLKQADVALYQAKDAGRNAIRFFSPAMQKAIDARSSLEAALRRALEAREFDLHLQAQVDRDGRCTGAEALLRWHHPQRGLVPPGEFIPLAEETGLILDIGDWVLDRAAALLRAWSADPARCRLDVSVNISARQFHATDFVERVRAALQRHDANPARLKLELTESGVLDGVDEAARRMEELHAMGVRFSLDDFGTGYSSLAYLKRLPLDELKIDQTFVRDLTVDANDAAIVQAVLAMSRTLKLQVVAEGVETPAQHAFLSAHGCQVFQGYIFGRPQAAATWAPPTAQPD